MEKLMLLRRSFIWNTLASITNACMSFMMILITMQVCGTEAGGIFSIAFSSSQMLQTVALFGTRNYQATDISFHFQFKEYLSSRLITSFIMMITCGLYARIMGFIGEKFVIYVLFCGVKVFEALADVLEGMIQQHNRLDQAAQMLFFRSILILLVFVIALLVGYPLISASWFAFFTSGLGVLLFSLPSALRFEKFSISTNYNRVKNLLMQCFPLFLVAAASAYINNASKIAIELCMDNWTQAQFAIVFMPAFVINLASGFIFRPLLNTMATYFITQDKTSFRKLMRLMIAIDVGITLIALIGTWLFGVPTLNLIYKVNISNQKRSLLIIVLSGGFCALTTLLCQALTVIRQQTAILFCYLITVGMTSIISNYFVANYGIIGAATLYLLSMVLLTVLLAFLYIHYIQKFDTHHTELSE